jgi:hypothetical protein
MKILRMFLMFSLNMEINRQSRFIESIKLSREILNDDIRYIDNRLINKYGNIDSGVVLYLMDRRSMDARALEQLLYHQSGLLDVSGISNDMSTLLASDDPRA